jgi:ABC-type transport system involved in cytochrome c biogenesis permease subunit
VLNSRLLPLHIATIMMAYTLLFFIFLSSLVGIIKSKLRQTTLHLSQLLLFPAIAFLCYGIFIGAIWANVSWGTYWSWDPKETWALITLMVYAVPAHRSIRMNRHVYMTLAFLSILITYFGVNFFLGGMHSYA